MGGKELSYNGYRVSVWDDKKVLEISIGDGRSISCMYFMQPNCTLKMEKMVNVIVCIFYYNEKA